MLTVYPACLVSCCLSGFASGSGLTPCSMLASVDLSCCSYRFFVLQFHALSGLWMLCIYCCSLINYFVTQAMVSPPIFCLPRDFGSVVTPQMQTWNRVTMEIHPSPAEPSWYSLTAMLESLLSHSFRHSNNQQVRSTKITGWWTECKPKTNIRMQKQQSATSCCYECQPRTSFWRDPGSLQKGQKLRMQTITWADAADAWLWNIQWELKVTEGHWRRKTGRLWAVGTRRGRPPVLLQNLSFVFIMSSVFNGCESFF